MLRTIYMLSLVCIAGLGTGYAGVKDSIGVTRINNVLMLKYLVAQGETIYGISTKYHVSIADLMEINPELESGLKVGQVIHIPCKEVAAKEAVRPSGSPRKHMVQPGETYYSLSRRYGTTVDQLKAWNNHEDLKAGHEIVVGREAGSSTAAVVASSQPDAKPAEQPKPVVVTTGPGSPEERSGTITPSVAAESIKNESLKSEPVKEEPVKVTPAAPVAGNPPQVEKSQEPQSAVKKEEPKVVEVAAVATKPAESAPAQESSIKTYPYDPDMKQLLIIPFDPYLYFSDADHEIAAKSKIVPTRVREVFRRRMTAMMQRSDYESIFLLGGKFEDTLRDLNKIYSSVSYGYQDVINSNVSGDVRAEKASGGNTRNKSWLDKQKEKFTSPQLAQKAVYDKNEGQYFGVKVRNPEEFFSYFGQKYSIDYYIFVNQFEVKTNYENCLDRAAHDFERTFTTHFSIFDATGKQIAGNKFKTFYNSNSSYIYTIVADNMDKIAQRILSELPGAGQ